MMGGAMTDTRDRTVRDALDADLLAWLHKWDDTIRPAMFAPAACWVQRSWLDVWPDLTVAQVGASLRRLRDRGLVQYHRYSVADQGWTMTCAERARLYAEQEVNDGR